MTALQLYEAVLIELRKENAPNILLELFNYFANKAINQYINKRYNIYDINQQTTDDLRVLKATAILPVVKVDNYKDLSLASNATYETTLPSDYLHILNCICIYELQKTYKCYNKGETWRSAATRLTADAYSLVLDNFWNRPTYKRPYYYIHNVNLNETVPTNPYNSKDEKIGDYVHGNHGTDLELPYPSNLILSNEQTGVSKFKFGGGDADEEFGKINENEMKYSYIGKNGTVRKKDFAQETDGSIFYIYDNDKSYYVVYHHDGGSGRQKFKEYNNFDDVRGGVIYLNKESDLFTSTKVTDSIGNPIDLSNIERTAQTRYGNASKVRLEIRYGSDDSVFKLKNVYIDYLKTPQNIRLTLQQLDRTEDTSQMLEYPDYVCQEIINELVHIIMENISDLRLLTHPVVSLSIANPAQQLTEPVAQLQPT